MTDSRVRSALVAVRCTRAEHADINHAAAARGLSASAYLRDLHARAAAPSDSRELAEVDVPRMVEVVREAVHRHGTLKDYLGSATTEAVARAAVRALVPSPSAEGTVHRAPNGGLFPLDCCGLHPSALCAGDSITWTDDLVTCEAR